VNTVMHGLEEAVYFPLVIIFLIPCLNVVKTLFKAHPDEKIVPEEPPKRPARPKTARKPRTQSEPKPAEDDWFSFDQRILDEYGSQHG